MHHDSEMRFWTTPNILTLLRLALVPIIVPLLLIGWGDGGDGDPRWLLLAFFLAVFSETTDLTDGFIARTRNEISRFGKLLDPLADSLTRIVLYMTFFAMGLIPLWMVFVFFVREHSVSYYRAFAANQGTVMAASSTGKIKSAVQVTSTLVSMLVLIVASQEELISPVNRPFVLGVCGVGAVAYFTYIFAFRLRGWVLWLLLGLSPVGLGALGAMLWLDLPAFDPQPLVYWSVFIAVVVTIWSFVDYTLALKKSFHGGGESSP